jgi:hypothetical protein
LEDARLNRHQSLLRIFEFVNNLENLREIKR